MVLKTSSARRAFITDACNYVAPWDNSLATLMLWEPFCTRLTQFFAKRREMNEPGPSCMPFSGWVWPLMCNKSYFKINLNVVHICISFPSIVIWRSFSHFFVTLANHICAWYITKFHFLCTDAHSTNYPCETVSNGSIEKNSRLAKPVLDRLQSHRVFPVDLTFPQPFCAHYWASLI